jgi:hypothetical protein
MILTTRDLSYLDGSFKQPKGSYSTPDRQAEDARKYCKCININPNRHWTEPCPECNRKVRI